MKVVLLRHGETEENFLGIIQGHSRGRLSARGREQAKLAAKRLSQERFDVLFSSDLVRAVDTLKAVMIYHAHVPVFFCAELRERCLGIYEGRPREDLFRAQRENGVCLLEYRPEGGESLLDLKTRTDQFLKRLLENYQGKTVLLCTHGGPILTLLATVLEFPLEEFIEHEIENASISTVELDDKGKVLQCTINSVLHLTKVGA